MPSTASLVAGINYRNDRTPLMEPELNLGLGERYLAELLSQHDGDIIRTVAVEPTFQSLGIVAGLVAIRTVLSFTLEVEITGAWPWQHHGPAEARAGNRAT